MPKAKQAEIPGMEEREIAPLRTLALEYAEVRDQRMELLKSEVELKGKILALMHQHKRQNYNCDGIEISVVPEGEKVKVRIKKEADEDE